MTALDGSRFAAHRQQLPSTWCDENTFFVCLFFFTPKSVYFSEFYLNLLLYRIVWNLDEQTYDTEQLQTELMPDPMPETQILAVSSVNFTLIPSATLFLQKW